MTTEKPKPHTNIFGNVEKVVSIGTVQGSVFVSTTAEDEPFSKSKAFQLGYHLGALDFFVSYQKRGIPLSPLLPNWIEEAQNRCAILANAIGLIVPEVPERYFDSMSEQLSAKPFVIKKCFHIGNIIGRGWFFGVSPMQAGVIPSDEFVLERLGQAENLLGEADLPINLLSTIRQIWEKAVSAAKTGQFAGNDKTDGEINQAIEGIIKTIEKYKTSSHTEGAMTTMKMVETKQDTIKINVLVTRTGERCTVEVPLDTLVRYAIDELIKLLDIPDRFENGWTVEYSLVNETQQYRQLQVGLSFRENKVNDGDTLTFVPIGKMG
jgi:hypothetical protein